MQSLKVSLSFSCEGVGRQTMRSLLMLGVIFSGPVREQGRCNRRRRHAGRKSVLRRPVLDCGS